MKAHFKLNSDREPVLVIPDSMTLLEAGMHAFKTGIDHGLHYVEFDVAGHNMVVGYLELGAIRAGDAQLDEHLVRNFLLHNLRECYGISLPCDNKILEAYPLRSASMEKLFSTPHGSFNRDVVKEHVESIQKDYLDHLFSLLKPVLQSNDWAMQNKLLRTLDDAVLDHIPNSRAFLTPERRAELYGFAQETSLLTAGLADRIHNAGIGPSVWEDMPYKFAIAQAQQEGRIVIPENPQVQ